MARLETEDIQGLIARGYKDLKAARFILLHITDETGAKKYLKSLLSKNEITPARKANINPYQKPGEIIEYALHIAFTYKGLATLRLSHEILKNFQRPFIEGMTEETRTKILGDHGNSHPSKWQWGGYDRKEVHLMLLCYAKTEDDLKQLVNTQKNAFKGLSIVKEQETFDTPASKEHFGFHDGISQPPIAGFGSSKGDKYKVKDPIKAGEFILGYENEYCQYSESPLVKLSHDPGNYLPASNQNASVKDLGKNGTYLIYRQITQQVFNFWNYLKQHSNEPIDKNSTDPIVEAAIKLGSKMVGRWPGGASLVNNPAYKNRCREVDIEIKYWKKDRHGEKCPFGAHIRRTNPRDQLFSGRDYETSKQMVRKHQILRRGRVFGKPFVEGMEPEIMLQVEEDDNIERGLHFICLVSDISRQFEFIQDVWVNNPVFADMYNEVDPIIGTRENTHEIYNQDFTCPGSPVRRKYKSIPQFTSVVGGAYFFLPGIKALEFIANHNDTVPTTVK